jgi:hypothetical protein
MEAYGARIRIDQTRRSRGRLRRLFAPRPRARGVRAGGPAGPADRLMVTPNRAL